MKCVKKPVVVEARQLTPENAAELAEWCGGSPCRYPLETPLPVNEWPAGIVIETREGSMEAHQGDWIIEEPFPTGDRRFYPCKPDIFEATYCALDELDVME